MWLIASWCFCAKILSARLYFMPNSVYVCVCNSIRWFIPSYRFPICSFISVSTHSHTNRHLFRLFLCIFFSPTDAEVLCSALFLCTYQNFYLNEYTIMAFLVALSFCSLLNNAPNQLFDSFFFVHSFWSLSFFSCHHFSLTPSICEMIDSSVCGVCMNATETHNRRTLYRSAHRQQKFDRKSVIYCQSIRICNLLNMISCGVCFRWSIVSQCIDVAFHISVSVSLVLSRSIRSSIGSIHLNNIYPLASIQIMRYIDWF